MPLGRVSISGVPVPGATGLVDDRLNLTGHLVRAFGATLGGDHHGNALSLELACQTSNGVAMRPERLGDLHVERQPRLGQRRDAHPLGVTVRSVVHVDRGRTQKHRPLPVAVHQPQPLADRNPDRPPDLDQHRLGVVPAGLRMMCPHGGGYTHRPPEPSPSNNKLSAKAAVLEPRCPDLSTWMDGR